MDCLQRSSGRVSSGLVSNRAATLGANALSATVAVGEPVDPMARIHLSKQESLARGGSVAGQTQRVPLARDMTSDSALQQRLAGLPKPTP